MAYEIEQKANVVNLTIKGKWYDKIESREKPEEYRDIKPFWAKRFLCDVATKDPTITLEKICELIQKGSDEVVYDFSVYKGDKVRFARGGHFHKSIPQMILECEGMEVREGNPAWGAEPGKKYFVIKLGEKITNGK